MVGRPYFSVEYAAPLKFHSLFYCSFLCLTLITASLKHTLSGQRLVQNQQSNKVQRR